eukprot:gene9044-6204_t
MEDGNDSDGGDDSYWLPSPERSAAQPRGVEDTGDIFADLALAIRALQEEEGSPAGEDVADAHEELGDEALLEFSLTLAEEEADFARMVWGQDGIPDAPFSASRRRACPPPCYPRRQGGPDGPLSLLCSAAELPTSFKVLDWNTGKGIKVDLIRLNSLCQVRGYDAICLQELSANSGIPTGYQVPRQLTKLARAQGSKVPKAAVAVKDEYARNVHSCSYAGSAGRGYFSRVALLSGTGLCHILSLHPPVHGEPEDVFDAWIDMVEADLTVHVGPADVVVAGGDLNCSPFGGAGYSGKKDAAWVCEDARRMCQLHTLDLDGPDFPGPLGQLPRSALTRTDPKTGEASLYDFFLTRGVNPPAVQVVERWEGMRSDHQPVEGIFDLVLPRVDDEALRFRMGAPRRQQEAGSKQEKYEACRDAVAEAVTLLPEGAVDSGDIG